MTMTAKNSRRAQLLKDFFASLEEAPHSLLMLDYDGTLAPFRIKPGKAVPYPGVRSILRRIQRNERTRVVLISGRWTRDLIPLLRLDPLPEMWGSHGWERRHADGRYEIFAFDERALRGLAEADRWVEKKDLEDQAEQKPGCLALHWRGLGRQKIADIRSQTLRDWTRLARRTGLEVTEFDGGVELRVPGRNKGDAVRTVLREGGPDAVPAYLGDDRTDEDAFRAVRKRGLGVLVRRTRRPTSARVWLRPPGELLDFLKRWHQHTKRGR
jgi:trehalose 6-phosphate phosphatase